MSINAAADKSMAKLTKKMAASQQVDKSYEKYMSGIGKVALIPLSDIDSSQNIRKEPIDIKSHSFQLLKKSIEQDGLLQNIVLELRPKEGLVCLAGHRRLEAFKQLKKETIRALILDELASASRAVTAALSENQHREPLHFLDVADGYKQLKDQDWSTQQLAEHYERDEKTIRRYLQIAELPDDIKALFRKHPSKFSLRTVMHEFVQKSYPSPEELRKAVERHIVGEKPEKPSKDEQLRTMLAKYQSDRKLTPEQKELTIDVLHYLKILK